MGFKDGAVLRFIQLFNNRGGFNVYKFEGTRIKLAREAILLLCTLILFNNLNVFVIQSDSLMQAKEEFAKANLDAESSIIIIKGLILLMAVLIPLITAVVMKMIVRLFAPDRNFSTGVSWMWLMIAMIPQTIYAITVYVFTSNQANQLVTFSFSILSIFIYTCLMWLNKVFNSKNKYFYVGLTLMLLQVGLGLLMSK
ncbi:hypothetical protein IV67_GL001237 [Weissella minor]|uniref:Yip1 domain-containing protein n=1 Tax=Weissella minor TaxID=1620 RepID=A0A0R2JNW7_9LACO|nr:hypothetical protein IV67_GL001237 [Weissella minor]